MANAETSNAKETKAISPALVSDLLQVIKDGESYGDAIIPVDPYNVRHGSRKDQGLTGLTVGEVYELLKQDNKASGAYQISRDTLEWLVKYSGLDVSWEDTFSPEVQDKMAVRLLERRGLNEYMNGDLSGEEFAKRLSKEWAGLPKDDSEKTYYDEVKMKALGLTGANAANVGWADVLTALPTPFPDIPAYKSQPIKLGNLRINEPPEAEGIPVGVSDFDFDKANRGMLEEITDLPTRRGGGEILNEVQAPRRSGRFPEVTVPQRGGRFPEVTPTQRGQIPIPQGPRLEEVSVPQRAGRFPEIQPQSSRIDPTPPPLPELEEVVPTQRGQIPIPVEAPVAPEEKPKVVQEVEADGVGTGMPASPEAVLSSPEEVALGVKIVTPRVERESVQDFSPPKMTDQPVMVTQAPTKKLYLPQFEPTVNKPPYAVTSQSNIDLARQALGVQESSRVSDNTDLARQALAGRTDFQTSSEYLLKGSMRNLANYGTFNTFDYIDSGIRSLFGADYDEAFKAARERRRTVETAFPKTQLAGEIGAGLLSGKPVYDLGARTIGQRATGAIEGGTYMGLSGDTNQERLELAFIGSLMGLGLGQVAHMATRPAKEGVKTARTEADEAIDDEILEQNIYQAIKNKSTVLYRANPAYRTDPNTGIKVKDSGRLKRVTPIRRIKKKKRQDFQSKEKEFLVRDEAGNEFVVQASKLERVNLTGANTKQFEQTMKFENSNYQFKPARQVITEKYDENGKLVLTKEGEEALARGEPLNAGMVQMELRDATWKDARTAGELWDSLVEGGKKLYAEFVRGTEDTLWQKVSKQVGAFYQMASTTATRQTTKDFVGIAQPLTPLAKAIDKDKKLKALIGDVTNKRNLIEKYGANTSRGRWIRENVTVEELEKYILNNYGQDNLNAWKAYKEWNYGKKEVHVEYLSGMEQFRRKNSPDPHIHMSLTKEAREREIRKSQLKRGTKVEYNPMSREDSALEKRTRGSFMLRLEGMADDGPNVDDYLNPLFTDFRRTANMEQLYQIGKKFGLKMPDLDSGEQAYKVFDRIEQHLVERGINPPAAKYAAKLMADDFIGSTRSPNGWLQALNSIGYAGSLAGFKSAVLNLHDIPMAAVLYGPKSFRGIAKVKGMDIEDAGIRQNVGEFRDRMIDAMRTGQLTPEAYAAMITRKGTDMLMKASGFSWFDTVGKNSISKMIVQNAVDTVDELEKRWGFYFDERQIAVLKNAIKKHGTDLTKYKGEQSELMEELFFAGLGQQQLISMSGRPAAWARHPNFRFMWALRGFAIKQLALTEKNVVDNILEGNIKEAVEYMKNYVIFAAGAFGMLNEARQWMWGDGNFTAGGVLMGMGDQIVSTMSINTIGLNDYQWGRMMQNGIALTFLESLIPIGIDIPKDIILDIADAADGDVGNKEDLTVGQRFMYPAAQLPILKQAGNMFNNLSDTNIAGIPIKAPLPQPLKKINEKYILMDTDGE